MARTPRFRPRRERSPACSGCKRRPRVVGQRRYNRSVSGPEGGRLLLIDDDEDCLEVSKLIFDDAGFITQTLARAERATVLALVHRFRPEVILLDLVMPLATGEEVAGRLHEDPVARTVPILATSALSDGRSLALSMRAAGFLSKPYSAQTLMDAVARVRAA